MTSVVGWTGTAEPGGGRTARGYVDGVRVSVRRRIDGTVTWRCREHGDANQPHCPHTRALAEAPADPEKHHPSPRRT